MNAIKSDMTLNEPPAVRLVNVMKSYNAFGAVRSKGTAANFATFFKKVTGIGGRRVTALDGVSFEIRRGEVFGLLGPNGAGKTTIIKILSTLVLPDSGEAYVDGINVARRPRAAVRHLHTVLSGTRLGFDPRLTGRGSLQFFADLYGMPKKESRQKIEELLEFAGMTEWADVMFQRYSTGMMRKLLVCRALLSNSSVLLFDEPTAALDPISAADFRKLIRDDLANKQRKTVMVATHNLWEAEQLCDRIALLRKGRIIAVGTPDYIKRRVLDWVSLTILVKNLLPEGTKTLTEALFGVRGVTSVEVQENAVDTGRTRLSIEGDQGINYTQVFERLSLMRVEIDSIESSQPTLEEAFLKLNMEASG